MKTVYPPQLRRDRLLHWPGLVCFWLCVWASLIILGMGGFAEPFRPWQWIDYSLVTALIGAICRGTARSQFIVGIVPYYSARVPGTDTFDRGRALARNYGRLDELAYAAGVRRLTRFSFSPLPIEPETLNWHQPQDGVNTLTALLKAVIAHPSCVDDAKEVSDDLTRILRALELARSAGVQFAFTLKIGTGYTPMAWERGGGWP